MGEAGYPRDNFRFDSMSILIYAPGPCATGQIVPTWATLT